MHSVFFGSEKISGKDTLFLLISSICTIALCEVQFSLACATRHFPLLFEEGVHEVRGRCIKNEKVLVNRFCIHEIEILLPRPTATPST